MAKSVIDNNFVAGSEANENDNVLEAVDGSSEAPEEKRPRRKPSEGRGGPPQRTGGYNRPGAGNGAPPGRRGGYFPGRRRVCPIKLEDVDWKNIDSLRYFVSESGSIRPRRKTGADAKLQRRVAVAVKRARHMALLPYTSEHVRITGRR